MYYMWLNMLRSLSAGDVNGSSESMLRLYLMV